MGDAQFGKHGATALRWMTLEGTKSAGTDLLLQANAGMSIVEAQKLAENLHASTKGRNTHRPDMFDRMFWFGGSESFVFRSFTSTLSDQC